MKKIVLFVIGFFIGVSMEAQTYPESYSEISRYEYVSRVQLSTLDNTSGASNYTDYTDEDMVAGLVRGQTYTLTVTGYVTDNNEWEECVVVWIDFNRDYDFDDAGEQILEEELTFTGSHDFTVTFTVPDDAVQGRTRMRVAIKYIGRQSGGRYCPSSDDVFRYGEVEDYRLAIDVPAIVTLPVTGISGTTAWSGGNILSDDNSADTERGICWGTSPDPTIDVDSVATDDQTGTGIYNLQMTDLVNGETYYVRAYAKNADGIMYGQNETFSIYNVHYVSKYGDDTNGDGTIDNPWKTVTNAVSKSIAGDKIIVMDTVVDNDINIDKNLTIEGMNGPSGSVVQASETFDNTIDARVFYVSQDITVIFKDLTIKYGYVENLGGGIYIDDGADVTVEHCVIDSNFCISSSYYLYGGGIYCKEAYMEIKNSEIAYNVADYGGGIYLDTYAECDIYNSTIANNNAYTRDGGGVWASGDAAQNFYNVTIADNNADRYGGGVYGNLDPSLAYFYNSLLGDNTPDDADGAIHSEDYNLIEDCNANITGTKDNDIYGEDPQLDAFDYYDADTRTFKLLPVSPAIDAANDSIATETDQRGKYRFKTADIGAHEYLGTDTYIWDGQGGTGSWFDVSLWSGNFLPSEQTAATVRNGYCNVDDDKGQVYNLTIDSTATLDINFNDTIVTGGDIVNLSSSPTGEGRFLLDGNAGRVQSLRGIFGLVELNNIYGVEVDSFVNFANDVVFTTGVLDIDSSTVVFKRNLLYTEGRIVLDNGSHIIISDTTGADTFPLYLGYASNLEIDRAAGAQMMMDLKVNDTLALSSGNLVLADTLKLEGILDLQGGGMFGSDTSVVVVEGTADTATLPGVELNSLIVTRAAGASIAADDTLVIDTSIVLNGGNLYLNGGDLLIRGIVTGTDSIAGNSASDMIIESKQFDLVLMDGYRTLDTLIVNNADSVFMKAPLLTTGGLDIANGTLFINPGTYLTNNGNTLIDASGTLYIRSDTTGTGSFVDNGTITQTGKAIVERYTSGDNFTYISAPMADVPSSQITGIESNTNPNFYSYDETAQSTWNGGNHDDITGWTRPPVLVADSLEVTRGYGIYYPYNVIYKMSGSTLNTGNISSITVTYTDYSDIDTAYEGWNLIGNPYPSKLDAEAFLNANSDYIISAVYLWDEPADNVYSSDDYAVWSPTGAVAGGGGNVPDQMIDVGQGFFVKVKSTVSSANLTFDNSMRVADGRNTFFKEGTLNSLPKVWLNLANEDTSLVNQILLVDNEYSSKGYDDYDIYKNEGNSKIAFYSLIGSDRFIIQNVPALADSVEIPLGYRVADAGIYVISIAKTENDDNLLDLILYDKVTGQETDLTKDDYVFTTDAGRFDDRFVINMYRHEVKTTYWTAAQGDWTDENNWSNGVPDKYKIAYVESGKVTVNSKAEAYKLVVPENAGIILNDSLSAQHIEITQLAGEAPLIFNPNLLNGEIDYSITLPKAKEQYLVSLPSQNVEIADVDLQTFFRNELIKAEPEPAYAYLASSDQAYAKIKSDSLTSSAYQVSIYTAQKNYIANPYNAYVNVYDLNLNKYANDYYSLDGSLQNGNYSVYNFNAGVGINGAGEYLKPMQTLIVDGKEYGNITFDYSMAKADASESFENPFLYVTVGDFANYDQAALVFAKCALDETDDFDSRKLMSKSDIYPQVYFRVGDDSLAINSMSEIEPGKPILFEVKVPAAGEFNLMFQTPDYSWFKDYDLRLIDYTNGEEQVMDFNKVYTIDAPGEGTYEFALVMDEKSSVDNNNTVEGITSPRIYAFDNNVYVQMPSQKQFEVEVYDMTGRFVQKQKFNTQSAVMKLNEDLKTGVYNVRVITSDGNTYENKILLMK